MSQSYLTKRTRLIPIFLVLSLGLFLLSGCGGEGSNAIACVGTNCDCPTNQNCDISDSACNGDSCNLECLDNNSCTGECGNSCSIECANGSACELTTADSSSISCDSDTDCVIDCGESCSVGCIDGSTCDLTVGDSGSVTCEENSDCSVTCTADCSVSCSSGATCELTCPGDTEPEIITESGSCEL